MTPLYTGGDAGAPAARAREPVRPTWSCRRSSPAAVEFLEHEEAEALYAAAEAIGPQWRTLIELGTEVGLRPGELYGLHGHRVDWLRGQIQVIDVMTRKGLRQWPKSQEVPPGRAGPGAHPGGHVGADDRPARGMRWCSPRRRAARSPTGTSATGSGTRPWRRRASAGSRRRIMRTPRLLAGAGRRAAVRRPGAARARGLRHDAAVRPPGAGCARQGHRVVERGALTHL